MNAPDTTVSGKLRGNAYGAQFRNQATGTGQSLKASEVSGGMRSQRVIDAAPRSQLAVHDLTYPAPHPEQNIDGTLRDKVTGKPWKLMNLGPHL